MTLFDWHVLRRFCSGSLLLVALLSVTFVTLDFSERVDDFLDRGATTGQILTDYYLFFLADIVRQVTPLALFLSAVYVTARLAQSMQLTAVQMAGVSTWRTLRPFLLVGAAVTVAMVGFNGWVVPRANRVVIDFQNEYYRDAPDGFGRSEIFRQVAPGVVVTARFYDSDQRQAYGVSVVTLDTTAGVRARLDAGDMVWDDSLQTWTARDVLLRTFSESGAETFRSVAELDTALAVLPRDLAQSERDADRLTLPEARAYVASLERAGVTERGRQAVATHAKVAYPFANLVVVLLGVPLAARRRRGGQAVQLAVGLAVAFLYLTLQKTIEPLGYVQAIPPAAAAWLPHVLFGAVAVALLVRADR